MSSRSHRYSRSPSSSTHRSSNTTGGGGDYSKDKHYSSRSSRTRYDRTENTPKGGKDGYKSSDEYHHSKSSDRGKSYSGNSSSSRYSLKFDKSSRTSGSSSSNTKYIHRSSNHRKHRRSSRSSNSSTERSKSSHYERNRSTRSSSKSSTASSYSSRSSRKSVITDKLNNKDDNDVICLDSPQQQRQSPPKKSNIISLDFLDLPTKQEAIDELEKDEFNQKMFVPSATKSKVLIDLQSQTISVPNIKSIEEIDTIFHASLYADDNIRMEKWIKKLHNFRQKLLL